MPESDYGSQLEDSRKLWDDASASFDDDPDHGLLNPIVHAAWVALLRQYLPEAPVEILDIGCGTGSLSLVMAEQGHTVTGVDLSPRMLAIAQKKAEAAGQQIAFQEMDAAFPTLPPQTFDVIVCRHLLWALPDPDQMLQRWVKLIKPGGHLLLIEGFWHTGTGLHASDLRKLLPSSLVDVKVQSLSHQSDLWGKTVDDERFVIHAMVKTNT